MHDDFLGKDGLKKIILRNNPERNLELILKGYQFQEEKEKNKRNGYVPEIFTFRNGIKKGKKFWFK